MNEHLAERRELLELARDVAREAGDLLLGWFGRTASGVESKSTATDLVSDADREAEELITALIAKQRPDDGLLAEEGGHEQPASGIRWIVDPLDGTVNFLFRIPQWCVSIAIEDAHGVFVGVIHEPVRSETYTALRGHGAEMNGASIVTSEKTDLADALIATGFSYDADARRIQAERLPRLLPSVRDIRRAGSAALDLAAVASGRLDGYFESPMEVWDRAAGVLLVEEAGGVVSDLAAPLGLPTGVVAAGAGLHDELRRVVVE